ncbi:hypothetical protein V6R21_13955 [Limibacter armeniacum]|uniref:hypothetical protein n=1 Tax=Limibacter armeniacum TaxID=466084 RepID=UPI002FE6A4C3
MKEYERKGEKAEKFHAEDETDLLELIKKRKEENEALQNLIKALTKQRGKERGGN